MNRKPIIVAVLVALAAVGGLFGYQYFFGGPGAIRFTAACCIKECGWAGHVNVEPGPGVPFPPQCPKCGRNTVLPVATCKKCGNQQVLNEQVRNLRDAEDKFVIPGAEKLPDSTRCDKCGGPIKHGD